MRVARRIFGVCAGEFADTGGAGDLDLGAAELGVIEEEGCFCSGLFLKGDCSALRAIGLLGCWGDGKGGDFTAGCCQML